MITLHILLQFMFLDDVFEVSEYLWRWGIAMRVSWCWISERWWKLTSSTSLALGAMRIGSSLLARCCQQGRIYLPSDDMMLQCHKHIRGIWLINQQCSTRGGTNLLILKPSPTDFRIFLITDHLNSIIGFPKNLRNVDSGSPEPND